MEFLDNGSTMTVTYPSGSLPVGRYAIRVSTNYDKGFAIVDIPAVDVVWQAGSPSLSTTSSSFLGGKNLVIQGTGFDQLYPNRNRVSICGK